MTHDTDRNAAVEATWRSSLTTGDLPDGKGVPWFERPFIRSVARRLPANPRCKLCYDPFCLPIGRQLPPLTTMLYWRSYRSS